MKTLILIISFAGYSCFVYSSDDKCETQFQYMVQQKPSKLVKALGLKTNKSAKQIKRIYRSHLKKHIEDIKTDVPPIELTILEEEHSHIPGHIVATLYDKPVYLKPIETEHDLKVLAALQTLSEIGAPVLFTGVTQLDEDGPLYIMSPFKQGGVATLLSASEISENLPIRKIKEQISDFYSFFSKNGVIPQDLTLFVSTNSDIFIVNSSFDFSGSSLRSSVSKEIELELNKIKTNIERRRGVFMSQKKEEHHPEQHSNKSPSTSKDTLPTPQTQKKPVIDPLNPPPVLTAFYHPSKTQESPREDNDSIEERVEGREIVEQPSNSMTNTNEPYWPTDSAESSEKQSNISSQTVEESSYFINPKTPQDPFNVKSISGRDDDLTRQEDPSDVDSTPSSYGNDFYPSSLETSENPFPEESIHNNDHQELPDSSNGRYYLDQPQPPHAVSSFPSEIHETQLDDREAEAQDTLARTLGIPTAQDTLALTLGIHETQFADREQDTLARTSEIHETQLDDREAEETSALSSRIYETQIVAEETNLQVSLSLTLGDETQSTGREAQDTLARTLGIHETQRNPSGTKEFSSSKRSNNQKNSSPSSPTNHSNVVPFHKQNH